ncbi:MAG: radical SAM protein [Oscillospiraceae bacterium]|nr:radical SAM protein [Oscillospiraceae bacterium]
MPLSVARIYYPVKTLGPGERIGIWTAGCCRNCQGCISPELKSIEAGKELSTSEIIGIIRRIGKSPDGFTISGGEPFLQPDALCDLVEELALISDDILIYTGFTLDELAAMHDENVDRIIAQSSAIVDGPYVDELNDSIGIRGSSNQKLHVFRHHELYRGLDACKREVQTVLYGNSMLTIGIPEVKK